jgi:hypothetical protein
MRTVRAIYASQDNRSNRSTARVLMVRFADIVVSDGNSRGDENTVMTRRPRLL